ncbi:TdiB protein [Colletotrichum higginsianum]|uniref:TdiB protein n=2 Tax=Colletotrichum higginsianum TaxID=80884 RepID=H1V7H6_COLHI|nr:TdiB protein [Colletotrichum higginsianum IMI 349063]OBR03216.1 TdiB protein [Colletotrichum higginsianum IMI 349063]TIC90012.1 Indole prenyltransferase tdiB [Colletotrichum higginsianum]GJD02433.1 tdiB protein [Colletotrichum higginsianum]CCF36178.1 TdiB protein [Colletotrichum higginsianum]
MSKTVLIRPRGPVLSAASLDTGPEDVDFWSSYLVPRFHAYLSEAGSYTPEQQAAHLSCVRAAAVALGPKHPHPHVKSALTKNGSPIELSFNLSEDRLPTARFYIEPLGPETGTENDPFGESWAARGFSCLASQMTSMDTSWYEHLGQAFRLKGQVEVDTANSQSRPGMWLPKVFLGVDFKGADRMLKCGFCPLLKLSAMGAKWDRLADHNKFVLDVVRGLPGCGANMSAALGMLERYLVQDREHSAGAQGQGDGVDDGRKDASSMCQACAKANRPKPFFNLVSVDCADPSNGKGRVKLYTRTSCNAFACIRDAVTLGGRLTDEDTLEGLRRLRSVWHLLLNDPVSQHDDEYSRTVAVESHRQGIDINWEISDQLPAPQAKVYVPVSMFHENDLGANRNLSEAFRKLNWLEWAEGRYEKMLGRVFPEADFATSHVNTWISYCYYKGRGSYMTMYHSPPW